MSYPTLPAIEIVQGQDGAIIATGLGDVSGQLFQLTIREDPDYGSRAGGDQYYRTLDLDLSGWPSVLDSQTSPGESDPLNGEAGIAVTRVQTSALQPGRNRYVADMWRIDDSNFYPVWGPCFVTVVSPAYPPLP